MCPCGNEVEYLSCCGKYIEQGELPPTPEALMRSRYTAYTLNNMSYIVSTMKGKALTHFNKNRVKTSADPNNVVWEGLTVLSQTMKTDRLAYVTFEALYRLDNQLHSLCEKSEFRKFENKWFYIDGKSKKRE